jgi:hypothetical protein
MATIAKGQNKGGKWFALNVATPKSHHADIVVTDSNKRKFANGDYVYYVSARRVNYRQGRNVASWGWVKPYAKAASGEMYMTRAEAIALYERKLKTKAA